MRYEITAEMNLRNIIEETREVSRALYEFADKLESIERKYKELQKPSVKPQEPKWIPVSERLPEEIGTYMTTINYDGEHGLVTERYYYGRDLKWNDECVIAWMPLPEPYKGGEKDE